MPPRHQLLFNYALDDMNGAPHIFGQEGKRTEGGAMLNYFLWVYVGLGLVLLAEIVAGRHKGVYRGGEVPLIVIGLAVGRFVMAPIASVMMAWAYATALPAL